MKKQFYQEKVDQAISILNEKEIDLWLIFTRESNTIKDPSLETVFGTSVTWSSALLINRNGDSTAIVGSLDAPNVSTETVFKNVEGYVQSIQEPLLNYLNKHNPKKIALNYSQDSNLADGLTHGMFLTLQNILKDSVYIDRFVSSEEIISALRGRKTTTELQIMSEAVVETLKIFDEATKFISAGRTELEIAAHMKKVTLERGFGFSWAEAYCPSVFTGPDTAGAHAGPTDRVVEKGHLINIDFGINFKGYCSDLQRTWYILRDDETDAPESVKFGFDVLLTSIKKAAAVIKPGVTGCEVDDAARNHITSNGFDEYQHGLGHQVGKLAHDGGSGLFPRWDRYGNLPYMPLEKDQVFTIEPRLNVKDHGIVTIEEEVVVTETGCRYLSKPQEELILIK